MEPVTLFPQRSSGRPDADSSPDAATLLGALEGDGFLLIEPEGSADLQAAEALFDRRIDGSPSGSCRLSCDDPLLSLLMDLPQVRELVGRGIGENARPVRAIAFNKTAKANWSVPWHQDRTIAVRQRCEAPAVRNWTRKAGMDHCEPPISLLDGMLTLRWHLNAVGESDGCLRVLPGSHRLGRLEQAAILDLRRRVAAVDIAAPRGSVLLFKPLLVHSSRKRTSQGRRRTLHVELSAEEPPAPLRWAAA